MAEHSDSSEARPAPPPLKVPEREPNADNPWSDDVLDRKEIADRLTGIVRDQQEPFVITVDGGWGTGKTFLLKRWRQQLENDGYQAIYFNAWEDDFSHGPLLAIIGQLSEYFDDGMLQNIALEIASAALTIITKQLTGTAIKLNDLTAQSLLDAYKAQQETKQEVKIQLTRLAV